MTGRWVLHEHEVPRHHFDLRLELNGVLASWAVPRGLPTDSTRNRLAVAVPDHNIDHLTYTDDQKTIADTGVFDLIEQTPDKLVFTLVGNDSTVGYALIHTDGTQWLLHRLKAPRSRNTQSPQ